MIISDITAGELEQEFNCLIKSGFNNLEIVADSKHRVLVLRVKSRIFRIISKKATKSHGEDVESPRKHGIHMFKRRKNPYKRPIIGVSKCEFECKWLFKSKPGFSFRAFDEISREIIDGKMEHDVIIKEQKGTYTYEPREEQ